MLTEQIQLGRLLVEEKIISGAELDQALQIGERSVREGQRPRSVGSILIEMGCLTEEKMSRFLQLQLGIPVRALKAHEKVQADLVDVFGTDYCRSHHVLPVRYNDDDQSLVVLMADPSDLGLIEEMRFLSERDIEVVYSTESTILGFLASPGEGSAAGDSGSGRVVQLVDKILKNAISRNASDIHIEAGEGGVKVRFRIDGIMRSTGHRIEAGELQSIIARIKILASLDISERRLPQDGRILFNIGNRKVDLRISIIPGIHGESAVLRILDKSGLDFSLTALGLPADRLEVIRKHIARPNGLILMTGPTGSGKSTTLYGMLSEINEPVRKILTIEDPVEYQLDGIMQVHARPDIGLDFAAGLRSFLRHDPDVIMVGEIRDTETAEISIRAALTGHLVFSTLHTNDAASAITRLIDMHVAPYLVSGTLSVVMAQRLVRLLCKDCRKKKALNEEEISRMGLKGLIKPGSRFYHPIGCEKCEESGYTGRTAILEVLEINRAIREKINNGDSSFQLNQYLAKQGHQTLLDAGLAAAREGRTSLAEVVRVTVLD